MIQVGDYVAINADGRRSNLIHHSWHGKVFRVTRLTPARAFIFITRVPVESEICVPADCVELLDPTQVALRLLGD